MKLYCNHCINFREPLSCSIYGTPIGTKKCTIFKKKIKYYDNCKKCEFADDKTNSCLAGYHPSKDEYKCTNYIENLKRERRKLND